jgi:AbrB family looped-hinge helix DNA binding protein
MITRSVVVSPRGQVTIPKEIRELLSIVPGDRVEFRVQNGEVRIVRQLSVRDVAGSVKPLRKITDFNKMIREAKEEHFGRSMRRLGMGPKRR